MRRHASFLLVGMVALLGCYHATIDTGVAPSEKVIEKRWASSWILGLVPPSTTTTAAQCPAGVAKVETRQSFLNGLVNIVTMSIYTPMAIRVTCAQGVAAPQAALMAPASGATGTPQEAVPAAAEQAAESGEPAKVEVAD